MGYYSSGDGSDIDEQDEALAARTGAEVDKELSVLEAELEKGRRTMSSVEDILRAVEASEQRLQARIDQLENRLAAFMLDAQPYVQPPIPRSQPALPLEVRSGLSGQGA